MKISPAVIEALQAMGDAYDEYDPKSIRPTFAIIAAVLSNYNAGTATSIHQIARYLPLKSLGWMLNDIKKIPFLRLTPESCNPDEIPKILPADWFLLALPTVEAAPS